MQEAAGYYGLCFWALAKLCPLAGPLSAAPSAAAPNVPMPGVRGAVLGKEKKTSMCGEMERENGRERESGRERTT